MGKSGTTIFSIENEEIFQLTKLFAGQQSKTLKHFMWECVEEKTNKISRKSNNRALYGFIEITQPPNNIHDRKGWREYVDTLDKKDWKKFDELASFLINLTNDRRADLLKKYGKL